MEYRQIIEKNMNEAPVRWWPKYAYHFTDVNNAVSVLATGRLYCRTNAENQHLMKNDNASRQVINMTNEETPLMVRFYFRPLTPTQYYNEGFKHRQLRYDNDTYANIPVPVFFFFDLEKLLSDERTEFSQVQQSGHGADRYHTLEDFAKLDFEKIYGAGVPSKEDVPYRHAEIMYPDYYEVERSLTGIACRNDIEKSTLLNLLKDQNQQVFYKYKDRIRVIKENLFENNGIYVSGSDFYGDKISIQFSHTKSKRDYIRHMMQVNQITGELLPLPALVEFDWLNRSRVVYHREFKWNINYNEGKTYTFNGVPQISDAKTLRMKVYLDDKLMAVIQYQLVEVDIR